MARVVFFHGRHPWEWRIVWPYRSRSDGEYRAGFYAGSFAIGFHWVGA
jgi:hypothetical protein